MAMNPSPLLRRVRLALFGGTDHVRIREMRCAGCGACEIVCPADVLALDEAFSRPRIRAVRPDACHGCRRCVQVCPTEALVER